MRQGRQALGYGRGEGWLGGCCVEGRSEGCWPRRGSRRKVESRTRGIALLTYLVASEEEEEKEQGRQDRSGAKEQDSNNDDDDGGLVVARA